MKKKLKVKKAFSGSMMNATRRMVRPGTVINPVRGPGFTGNPRPGINVNPKTINPVRPGMQQPGGGTDFDFGPQRPGVQPLPSPIIDVGSQVGGPRPGMQQPAPGGFNINDMGPINVSPFNSTPGGVRGGMGPLPNNF
jgi:hypothetical protein